MSQACITCGMQFVAGKPKSGPTQTRCNFCKQTARSWVLRNCIWCGDLFGATRRDAKTCTANCRRLLHSAGRHFRAALRQKTKTCAYCKAYFQTSMLNKIYCSRKCGSKDRPWKPAGMSVKTARSGYAKRREAARKAGDKDLTTYTIWKADGGRCRLCGKETIDPTTPTKLKPAKRDAWASLDHIVPLSAGGTHTWLNAQLLCYPCNSGKVHTDRLRYGRGGQNLIATHVTVPSAEFVNSVGGVGLTSS